ncbi:MAG: hypothetical protein OEV31_02275 [Gammaproteobacteria bacterium]|nr:hypothetical protein [Gammaproteobacteria bacterium]
MRNTTRFLALVMAMSLSGIAVAADKYGTTKSTSPAAGKSSGVDPKKCMAGGKVHPVGSSICLDGSTTKCEQDGWKDQHQKCS